MAYFEGRWVPDRHWRPAARLDAFPIRIGRAAFQAVWPWTCHEPLDGLHDRVELIECCVGLGLMVSAFVLAVWLLPL